MPLFENRQEVNLRACEQLVETVLSHMGVDAQGSRLPGPAGEPGPTGPAWGLSCGSAHIYITLTSSPTSPDNYIHIVAPILRPAENPSADFWKRLLELNGRVLTGAAFGLRDGEVVVTTDRSTLGLDQAEVEDMIRRIGEYADLYDDALTREFGGTRHCDLPQPSR